MPPSRLLVEALEHVLTREYALDLGRGAGRDTLYLLQQGFAVTAVDNNVDVWGYLSKLPHQERLQFKSVDYERFNFQNYNVINARYALPFNPQNSIDEVMTKIKQSLLPSGVFVGQFFGVNDEWNTSSSTMNFQTLEDVNCLLGGLRQIKLKEEEYDGITANGNTKHWHVFHVIVQKEWRANRSG